MSKPKILKEVVGEPIKGRKLNEAENKVVKRNKKNKKINKKKIITEG